VVFVRKTIWGSQGSLSLVVVDLRQGSLIKLKRDVCKRIALSIKGNIVGAITDVFVKSRVLSPLGEKCLILAGHRFPTSKTVQSFCRHFGAKLMDQEGAESERIATFASGGRMSAGLHGQIGLLTLMHYFLGTITGQTQDERPIVRLLDRLMREGDVFFDVGANLGFYTFYVGPICGKSGSVHAFEPNPRLIPHLSRSIELNQTKSNIHLNAVAVGKKPNVHLPLYDPDRIGCSSLHLHEWLAKESMVQVPVTTIDSYIFKHGITKIDVMKIDIEGAELEALQGMEETFRVCPPGVIICELMPFENVYGRDRAEVLHRADTVAAPTEILRYLYAKGYELFQIGSFDGLLRSHKEPLSKIEQTKHVENVAFVFHDYKEKRPELFASN
jgi:FkbM family methyltransferase